MTAPNPPQPVLRGMMLMAAAMMVLPGMDAIAKYMATVEAMSPAQVTFYRFFFQVAVTLPVLLVLRGRKALTARKPGLNMLRGILHGAASLTFFVAVKYMPLADVFAIYFVEPFILTALSALFLQDRVGWRRWLAILIGFGGAMIVIQPSFEVFGLTALLPVLCAFLFAVYMFLNRALGDADSPMTMQILSGLGGTVFMGIVLAAGNSAGHVDFALSLPANAKGLALLVLLGAISGYLHLLVVKAFRMAPLSVLAPFQYFEIIAATILGYVLFGEFPTLSKWTGIAIIVGSGLFILWREQRKTQKETV
ncbi:DMT family transporter [Allorhizobium undicola]|uniref:DMT family transporter n=1 Tax=Allorhizobium undicola TaxID=78527 RepID=UPI000481E778|nr:DMT family transporter [Allorhizobium undicola]